MKIGDEVYVHGYVDEIRSDVVIIRNDGGYFGTVPSEVNCSEIPNSCEDEPRTGYCNDCKWFRDKQVCGRCRSKNLYAPKDEPQPRCPKCGKRGYIRSLESMGVKLKNFDEYKWKCTNCNKYFKEEPKDEPYFRNPTEEEMKCVNDYIRSISKPTGVNIFDFMDEPQTMPIKKTMTGSKGERVEYTEAEMVVRDEPQTERSEQ